MLHQQIHGFLTDGILNSKVVPEVGFYLRVIKTKLFGNILMDALAPLALPPPPPSNCGPGYDTQHR